MTQIIWAENEGRTNVTVFAIQPYRWEYYLAAFDVETMENVFDHLTDEQAIPIIDAALARIDANPDGFSQMVLKNRPPDFRSPRQMRAEIQSIKDFLVTNPGSKINGSYTDPDNP